MNKPEIKLIPKDLDRMIEKLTAAIEDGKLYRFSMEIKQKDGGTTITNMKLMEIKDVETV